MKERPIIFSDEMVRAILDGRKTQTRRPLKPQPVKVDESGRWYRMPSGGLSLNCYRNPYEGVNQLWVREAWRWMGDVDWRDIDANLSDSLYRASVDKEDAEGIRWKPSIHMPRRLSRIDLVINDVRVEKLRDISEDDAQAEGVEMQRYEQGEYYRAFREIWRKIYGNESWDLNPWVWVIEFERL